MNFNFCFCRKEIAQCIEKAYEKLEISEAARMLFLESKGAMISYAQSVGIIH